MSAQPVAPSAGVTSRWMGDLVSEVRRGRHVVLYGNVHDQFFNQGADVSAIDFLMGKFREIGFDVVGRYEPVHGLSFAQPEMRERFAAIWGSAAAPGGAAPAGGVTAPAPAAPAPPPAAAPGGRQSPLAALRAGGAPAAAPAAVAIEPGEAIAQIGEALRQRAGSVAMVIDLADMLTTAPDRYDPAERNLLVRLKQCTLEAADVETGRAAGYRNTLVIIASDLRRVPEWFHRDNPRVALVQATRPSREERLHFCTLTAGQFHQGPTGDAVGPWAAELADLTEGMQAWDLDAILRTSAREEIAVPTRETVRALVARFRLGRDVRDTDYWQKLDRDRIAGAEETLRRSVIGQDGAVRAVVDMLIGARTGITLKPPSGQGGKPKGIFFFVGPTGVGKTELAKALATLVFGDESFMVRFDMSEYAEQHAAEKLAGAPPGFTGYEEGGQLTNKVRARPHNILLFDEIEKAHPRVLDKFLQILEDGRLTDGKGQTAYFDQSALIFTSNLGASPRSMNNETRPGIDEAFPRAGGEPHPTVEQLKDHFAREVRWYFTSGIGRAELLNRIGDNVVVFDMLRPQHVRPVATISLTMLARSARASMSMEVRFDDSVLSAIEKRAAEGENAKNGYRGVKTVIESDVLRVLNRWTFEQGDAARDARVVVEWPAGAPRAAVRREA